MQPPGNAAIVLIHPNTLVREGIEKLLEGTPYGIAACAARAADVDFAEVSRRGKVIVLTGGIALARILETVRSIRNELDSGHILVMGAREPPDVMAALEAGADAYLSETITFQSLMRVMELVLGQATVLPLSFVKSLTGLGTSISESNDRGFDAGRNQCDKSNRKSGKFEGELFGLLRGPGSEPGGQRKGDSPAGNRERVGIKMVIRRSGGNGRRPSVWVVVGRLQISRGRAAKKES